MKILITGGKGMLAQDLVQPLHSREHQVLALGRTDLDVTVYNQVANVVKQFSPNLIIHCAAFTRVDDCERKQELALLVNGRGSRNVALLCEELNIPMVYISSDYVFEGNQAQGYAELDATGPLSVYGKSKLEGELEVQRHLQKFYIVRTSWLFGREGPSFVKTIIEMAAARPELTVVDDQTGSPTWRADLVPALVRLMSSGHFGIYHLTNSGATTWYGFARRILELIGSSTPVRPITSAELARPAPRPACSILLNQNWKRLTGEVLPSWEDALKNYLTAEGLMQGVGRMNDQRSQGRGPDQGVSAEGASSG